MGVPGTVGVLKKNASSISVPVTIENTKVVVDITESMYWFTKSRLRGRTDLYGCSMVSYSNCIRDLFKRFRERNVTPIVVYSGGRVSEEGYGEIASKKMYLEKSSRFALNRVARSEFGRHSSLPDICVNALKEVVNEFNLEHVYQAQYEVYPVIERLAKQHNCPVLTAHSDFIFTDLPAGFVWYDDLELPSDSSSPIKGRLYKHDLFLANFNRTTSEGQAMRALYTILREDFTEKHYQSVNRLLNLHGELSFAPNKKFGILTKRLLHIISNWPKNLTSLDSVTRTLLTDQRSVSLDRDYRGILESMSDGDFSQANLNRAFSPAEVGDFNTACTRRESSALFLMELRQRHSFNRMQTFEDLRTTRSTYSVADYAKQFLLNQLLQPAQILFDRRQSSPQYRKLAALGPQHHQQGRDPSITDRRMSCERLFGLFHFDTKTLKWVSEKLNSANPIDVDNSIRMALFLLIGRSAFKLAFRSTYDNEDRKLPSQAEVSAASVESGGADRASGHEYLMADWRLKFFTAMINSYQYNSSNLEGDATSQNIPADLRVARAKMNSLANENMPGPGQGDYFKVKHLIEMLNQSLHTYKELNSLYNFVGPNFLVNKFYDGVMMFRLMYKWSNNLSGHLVMPDAQLLDILSE